MELEAGAPSDYVGADDIIESTAPDVVALAVRLRAGRPGDADVTRAAYEWVRDQVSHSLDAHDRRVTLTATEVLRERTGLCFAKSHLLAALLRSQGIPAGLCYQRLADGDGHVLHGLVAVFLEDGWHRLDPRGNRPGIDAQFSLAGEQLAWVVDPERGEVDDVRVFVTPTPSVVAALRGADDALALCTSGLPSEL